MGIEMHYMSIILLIYCKIYIVFNHESSCGLNCEENRENIYSEEVNRIYTHITQTIENALQTYKPCNNSSCDCYTSVIGNDLKIYKKKGITKKMINSIQEKGTKYQIIDKRLYREKDCFFPSRCSGIEYFLLKLVPKLPNMDFIMNTRDWPQIYINHGIFGPLFSFSKTWEYADVMYPAWSFWEGGPAITLYPTGLGRWDKHRKSISEAGERFDWNNKTNKAFFRGSRTSSERDSLILLSRERPDLVNAQYTKNQAWKSDADTLHAPPATEISLEDHCQFKYLFNFRGVAASFRFKHLFLCKSLIFHVGNDWQEFFYPLLKPWVHYIPVNTRATKKDIQILIEYFKHHDTVAKTIANKGFQVIWNNLRMEDVICYWNKLLKKYSKLLKYKPELDSNMIEIQRK